MIYHWRLIQNFPPVHSGRIKWAVSVLRVLLITKISHEIPISLPPFVPQQYFFPSNITHVFP